MKIAEFRKLIREEVRKVVKEVRMTGKYYYVEFDGKQAVMGDPMNTKKAITDIAMDPEGVKNIGPVYQIKLGAYTIYVITSLRDKKEVFCVITPGNAAIAHDDDLRYELCMKAMSDARSGKGKQMTFNEYLSNTTP